MGAGWAPQGERGGGGAGHWQRHRLGSDGFGKELTSRFGFVSLSARFGVPWIGTGGAEPRPRIRQVSTSRPESWESQQPAADRREGFTPEWFGRV